MTSAPRRAALPPLLDVPLGSPTRPSWRGRVHLLGLVAVVPALMWLAVVAHGARARAGVIVYAIGLTAMLAVSTTYHRWIRTVRARLIWRRVDHATIYAAIAGTFTPIALISLSTGPAVAVLIGVWAFALLGAALKLADRRRAHHIATGMYIALGWAGVLIVPALVRRSGTVPVAMLLAGGVLYTVGAIAFARQWPTLRPSTFSFHEVWHVLTIAAAGFHFAAVSIVVT